MTAQQILQQLVDAGAPFEIVCSANDPDWLDKRQELAAQGYVGGSSIGGVLGIAPAWIGGPYTQWAKATGMMQRDMPDTEDLARGRHLEPGIGTWLAEEFTQETGIECEVVHAPFLLKSTRYPLACTLDFLFRHVEYDDPHGRGVFSFWYPLEIKSTRCDWADPKDPTTPPAHNVAQALSQALVLGAEHAMLCGSRYMGRPVYTWPLLALNDFMSGEDSRWESAIISSAREHKRQVQNDIAPEPTAADLEAVAAIEQQEPTPEPEVWDLAATERAREARTWIEEGAALQRAGKALGDAGKTRLIYMLNGADSAITTDGLTVERKTQKDSKTGEIKRIAGVKLMENK